MIRKNLLHPRKSDHRNSYEGLLERKGPDAFAQNGYAIVPHLFDRAEAQALKVEIYDILETIRHEATAAGKDPKRIADHGVSVGLAVRSPVFRQAVRDERLLDILEVILAPNIEFLSDKAVFKSDHMTFASPWHQDS